MDNMKQEGREKMRRAEETMAAAAAERELRRRLEAAKTPEEREPIKRDAFACIGLYPAHAALFSDVAADVNRLNGTGPATAAEIAKMGEQIERVEKQGAEIVAEHQRLKDGKRQAEEKPMDAAREVVETMLQGLDPQQSVLFLAMRRAKGNRTHAARDLKMAQGTVSKALPALRDAIRAAGREVPEFLLPPDERKRLPDAPRKMAYGADGVEAAETRTPFDEVAEKEESERGAE